MWRWFDQIEEYLAIILLGCTSLTILVSSTMRAIGTPITGGAELAQFFFIWTAVFGANITLRQGGQVRIDALTTRMPLPTLRIITGCCLLLMLIFLAMLVRYGFPLALSNWRRPLGVADLSYGYVTLALPVGAMLMFVTLIRRIVDKGIVRSLESDDTVVEETL